jgi:hypothetical protein
MPTWADVGAFGGFDERGLDERGFDVRGVGPA